MITVASQSPDIIFTFAGILLKRTCTFLRKAHGHLKDSQAPCRKKVQGHSVGLLALFLIHRLFFSWELCLKMFTGTFAMFKQVHGGKSEHCTEKKSLRELSIYVGARCNILSTPFPSTPNPHGFFTLPIPMNFLYPHTQHHFFF